MVLALTEVMFWWCPDKHDRKLKTLFLPWLFEICEVRAVGGQAVFCRHRVLPSQNHNKHELGAHFVSVARGQELRVISIAIYPFLHLPSDLIRS